VRKLARKKLKRMSRLRKIKLLQRPREKTNTVIGQYLDTYRVLSPRAEIDLRQTPPTPKQIKMGDLESRVISLEGRMLAQSMILRDVVVKVYKPSLWQKISNHIFK